MSGGFFDYSQYRIAQIADDIEFLIQDNDSTKKNEYGEDIGNHYPKEIIEKYKEAVITLRIAEKMVQRVDYLESGDDGEESFLERWKEELG